MFHWNSIKVRASISLDHRLLQGNAFKLHILPRWIAESTASYQRSSRKSLSLLEDCLPLTADSPHIWETSSLCCSSFLPKTFWLVLKKRSTEEFDSLPYVSTFLTAALWAYYGLIKPDGFLIVSVNIFGISLQICYLTIFLLFSPPNMRVRTATLVAIFDIGFVGATILISYLMLHGTSRIEVIGFICAALNIMNCGSPLGIAVPNLIGFLLGVMQLVIYVIYMNESKSSKEDHSSIHDQLLPSHSDTICDLLSSHSESNSSKIVLKITT
ncbi:Bidirectional sugar transporter SWEET17 [Cucurbita argyrosperma subsp. argyrosperma]|nr:Bidirectional sugar transporter SWEET17 [Cucurbita argyrosperma subsp. argyrosperma]